MFQQNLFVLGAGTDGRIWGHQASWSEKRRVGNNVASLPCAGVTDLFSCAARFHGGLYAP